MNTHQTVLPSFADSTLFDPDSLHLFKAPLKRRPGGRDVPAATSPPAAATTTVTAEPRGADAAAPVPLWKASLDAMPDRAGRAETLVHVLLIVLMLAAIACAFGEIAAFVSSGGPLDHVVSAAYRR